MIGIRGEIASCTYMCFSLTLSLELRRLFVVSPILACNEARRCLREIIGREMITGSVEREGEERYQIAVRTLGD